MLAQFPALTIGFNTARDTSAVYSNGLQHRHHVAAVRSQPRQHRDRAGDPRSNCKTTTKHACWTRAVTSQRLLADLATLQRQRATLAAHAARLDAARRAAERAWQRDLLDWPTYLAIRGNALGADLDRVAARQQQASQAIALEALLGRTDVGHCDLPPSFEASTP